MTQATDTQEFLALTSLARKPTQEAFNTARAAFPNMSDAELTSKAYAAEKERNRALVRVALKVSPARKVTVWENTDNERSQAILECGHVVHIRPTKIARPIRCRQCMLQENLNIAEIARELHARTRN